MQGGKLVPEEGRKSEIVTNKRNKVTFKSENSSQRNTPRLEDSVFSVPPSCNNKGNRGAQLSPLQIKEPIIPPI